MDKTLFDDLVKSLSVVDMAMARKMVDWELHCSAL